MADNNTPVTLEHTIAISLSRVDGENAMYRSEMISIHAQLEVWLREKLIDKADQSHFMQDEYKVGITLDGENLNDEES